MFQILKDNWEYLQSARALRQRAKILCQQLDRPAEGILFDGLKKTGVAESRGASVGHPFAGKTRAYSPMELRPFLETLLEQGAEVSAWLVLWRLPKVIMGYGFPLWMQGDIMMALENANYALPSYKEKAAKHLACSLCMLPSLHRARATLRNLGCPYSGRLMEESQLMTLKCQGFVSPQAVSHRPVPWNWEMRQAVRDAMEGFNPEVARLLSSRNMKVSP